MEAPPLSKNFGWVSIQPAKEFHVHEVQSNGASVSHFESMEPRIEEHNQCSKSPLV